MSAMSASRPETPAVDGPAWRRAMGAFTSGVTIVASADGGQVSATTVSAFSSLSLDPPLLLACLDRDSRTLAMIRRSGVFSVNILAAHQGPLAMLCAARGTVNRLADAAWREGGASGAPLLDGAAAHIECRLQQAVDGGDHVILIGEGLAVEVDPEAEPLVYRHGRLHWRLGEPGA